MIHDTIKCYDTFFFSFMKTDIYHNPYHILSVAHGTYMIYFMIRDIMIQQYIQL